MIGSDKKDSERELLMGFAESQTVYSSASQSARVLTEGWVEQHAFCTNCGNDRLTKFANNRPLADFFCSSCNEQFELKSKKGAFGGKVVDGAYVTKIERLTSNTNPNLFLMNYDLKQLSVTNLIVHPQAFLRSSDHREAQSPSRYRCEGRMGRLEHPLEQRPRHGENIHRQRRAA